MNWESTGQLNTRSATGQHSWPQVVVASTYACRSTFTAAATITHLKDGGNHPHSFHKESKSGTETRNGHQEREPGGTRKHPIQYTLTGGQQRTQDALVVTEIRILSNKVGCNKHVSCKKDCEEASCKTLGNVRKCNYIATLSYKHRINEAASRRYSIKNNYKQVYNNKQTQQRHSLVR
jgi:hypothetical protein